MMALSVNRPIEADLSNVMGQRDPAVMIRSRSTGPIRASGLAPRIQAGHMTASDRTYQHAKKPLPAGGSEATASFQNLSPPQATPSRKWASASFG